MSWAARTASTGRLVSTGTDRPRQAPRRSLSFSREPASHDRNGDEGGSGTAGADDCVVTKQRVRLLYVDRSLIDDLARWLAPTDLRAAVVPAPLVGLVHGVAAARPEELTRNDPVPGTAAERQAAVLILIATDRADGPDVLLQQRAAKLRDHAGEVAFPGGAREDGDAGPPATAIREAAEETGVDPAAVEPLIVLPRLHIPPSRFDVTGVLAHWRTPSPVSAVDPGETSRVMRVPFAALADPENRIMLSTRFGWHGPAFVLDGAVVWGYTGEILGALLRFGGWQRPWVASDPLRSRPGMATGRLSCSVVRATASDRVVCPVTGILNVGHTGASRSSQSAEPIAATASLLRPTSCRQPSPSRSRPG